MNEEALETLKRLKTAIKLLEKMVEEGKERCENFRRMLCSSSGGGYDESNYVSFESQEDLYPELRILREHRKTLDNIRKVCPIEYFEVMQKHEVKQ